MLVGKEWIWIDFITPELVQGPEMHQSLTTFVPPESFLVILYAASTLISVQPYKTCHFVVVA